ncbi:hypothetical protein BDL97_10G032300 [Sphagnum fallax]|nr:hypothetical protein BDL97_10G032300 [Sphagnum fallax]KAH8949446.1 hypothetical protein BDL97_10G032300 [Sphagnum fallax]
MQTAVETVKKEVKDSIEMMMEGEKKHVPLSRYVQQREDNIAVGDCTIKEGEPKAQSGNQWSNPVRNSDINKPSHGPSNKPFQKEQFQQCGDYAKVKPVKTEGQAIVGLLADQDIKEGEFVIDFPGELLSDKDAESRAHAYNEAGLKKYIISLDGLEFIDATRKGSVARFINHSCEPNCMARKCRISGEVRIGLFALKDITAGTELSCNYNFLGHRVGKIRCQCGAPSCSGFQGMKSPGVKKDANNLEVRDERIVLENPKAAVPSLSPSYEKHRQPYYSNRELLYQLFDMAVGIRNFKVQEAKTMIAELVGEVKKRRSHTKRTVIKRSSAEPPELHAIADKTTANVLIASATVVEKAKTLVETPIRKLQIKAPLHQMTQNQLTSAAVTSDGVRKDKEITLEKKQARNAQEIRANRQRPISEEQLTGRKKAKLVVQQSKTVLNEKIHALFLNRHLFSETASSEVTAAQEEDAKVQTEMTELLGEIRMTMKDSGVADCTGIPLELTERWIGTTAKQLHATFNFHFSIVQHLARHLQPKARAGISGACTVGEIAK